MTRRPPLPEYDYSDLKRPIEVKAYSDPTERAELRQRCSGHGHVCVAEHGQAFCMVCGELI